jgi:hypothetical protein
MSNPRIRRYWTFFGLAIVGLIALMVPSAMLVHKDAFGLDAQTRVLLRTLTSTLAMAWTVTFAAISFRFTDEFKQQGSMFAWYWGGLIGVAVAAPIFVFIMAGGLALLWHQSPLPKPAALASGRAFALGFFLPLACQFAGFFVVRAWWDASKR